MSIISKRKLFTDKENINFLNDTSNSFYDVPIRETTLNNFFSNDTNATTLDSRDIAVRDELKTCKMKNMYLQQVLNKLQNDHRWAPNAADLLKENADLKAAKDQYIQQLKKNEDMLFKAREVISHLKADIKLDTLSQNLFNSLAIPTKPQKDKEIVVLQERLKNMELRITEQNKDIKAKDEHIEQLNKLVAQQNTDNFNLQKKLIKAIDKIKKMHQESEMSRFNEVSTVEYSIALDEKKDLRKKLDSTMQYNYDLFTNYSDLMKENSNLQSKVFNLEQEIIKLRSDVSDKYNSVTLIKEAEYKLDNLEANISRIEDTKVIIPQIEQKVDNLQRLQKDKLEVIKAAAVMLNESLNKTLQTLLKPDVTESRSYSQHSYSNSQSPSPIGISINSSMYSGFSMCEESHMNFHSLLQATKNEDIKFILEKMNVTKVLKQIIEALMKQIYAAVVESFKNKIFKKLTVFDKKLNRLEAMKISAKKTRPNPASNTIRSKSAIQPRKVSIHPNFVYQEIQRDEGIMGLIKNNNRYY